MRKLFHMREQIIKTQFINTLIILLLTTISCVDNRKNQRHIEKSKQAIDISNQIEIDIRKNSKGNQYSANQVQTEFIKALESISYSARIAQNEWTPRGPGNVAGRVKSIVVDLSDDEMSTWFAGTATGGLWKTTDTGDTWQNLSIDFPNLSIVSLAQSASNHQVLYAGSGEGGLFVASVNGYGIFKSSDGGESWNLLESTSIQNSIDFQNVNSLVVSPSDENTVYAACSNGAFGQEFRTDLMKTTDGGASWTPVFSPDGRITQVELDPENELTIYASVTSRGLYKSDDGGSSWSQTNLNTASGSQAFRTEIAIASSDPNYIYASVAYPNRSGSGLFLSTDKGVTWRVVESESTVANPIDYLVQGEYDNAIAVNPLNELEVMWGGVSLYFATIDDGNILTLGNGFTGATVVNTESFLDFVSFTGGTHFNGQIQITDETMTPNIEIRFGSGISQFAHRFTVPTGSTSGVPDADYSYQDFVEVPFEVWDIDNDIQLNVSFRDQEADGLFNLNFSEDDDTDRSNDREYLYIHELQYDGDVNSLIAIDGGHAENLYIFAWPTLVEDGVWDAENLPESQFIFNFGEREYQNATIEELQSTSTSTAFNGVHNDHHTLVPIFINENEVRILSGNDGGVAYTDNFGLNWVETENGLVNSQFYQTRKKPGENIYMGGTQDNDVLLSAENDALEFSDYIALDNSAIADGFEIIFNYSDPEKILISNQRNYIVKSENGGNTWDLATTGLTESGFNSIDAPFYTKLGYGRGLPNYVYAVSESGVWISRDFGDSWSLSAIFDPDWNNVTLDIEVSDLNPDIIWAGNGFDEDAGIFLSTDRGANFVEVLKPRDIGNLTSLVPSRLDMNTVYALFSIAGESKIMKSTDLGNSWVDLSGFDSGDGFSTNGFPDVAIFSLLEFPDNNTLWVGTEIGLIESVDNGLSWSLLDSNLPNVRVNDITVEDGEVVLATYGRGIWTMDLNLEYEIFTLGNDHLFDEVSLYPNPSNGNFFVQGESLKSYIIYDIMGKEILNGIIEDDLVELDIQIKAGIYFIDLFNGRGETTRKKISIQSGFN